MTGDLEGQPTIWGEWRDGYLADGTPCRYRFGMKQTVEDLTPIGTPQTLVRWKLYRQTQILEDPEEPTP